MQMAQVAVGGRRVGESFWGPAIGNGESAVETDRVTSTWSEIEW